MRNADLLVVVGSRLSETVSQSYALLDCPSPRQTVVHVHPDLQELNRLYRADLPILASLSSFAQAAAMLANSGASPWAQWTADARADYLERSTPPLPHPVLNGVDMGPVMAHLNEVLPDNAILTNGAGNYTVWLHRFYRYRQAATELAPTNGAMGYGLPAEIAAKLHAPERTVVCFAGDGCFMMYPQELATAIQYHAPVIVIVINNGMLGTTRMHQEREYPHRVSGTELVNPDFQMFARSFGAHTEFVEKSDYFPAAFARAKAAGKPALIELRTDPKQITPQTPLD